MLADAANLANEPAVDRACQDHGGKHPFQIVIPNQTLDAYHGRKLYVHGIRKNEGVQNAALDGSGAVLFPHLSLSGVYKNTATHPRVFTTQADLNDLVSRINSAGSFSAQSFLRFSDQIKKDLAAIAAPLECDVFRL